MENSEFLLSTLEKRELKRRFSVLAERVEQLQIQSHHTLGEIIRWSFPNLQNVGELIFITAFLSNTHIMNLLH